MPQILLNHSYMPLKDKSVCWSGWRPLCKMGLLKLLSQTRVTLYGINFEIFAWRIIALRCKKKRMQAETSIHIICLHRPLLLIWQKNSFWRLYLALYFLTLFQKCSLQYRISQCLMHHFMSHFSRHTENFWILAQYLIGKALNRLIALD